MLKSNNYTIPAIIVIGIICRLSLETLEIDWSYTWAYLSFLTIVASYYGIYSQRQNTEESFDFMMDFKGAAQGGALFAIGYGAFTYLFYKLIQPHFLEIFIATRRTDIANALAESNANQETISLAIENFNSFADMIYVPGNLAIITVTSLTFLSFFYAMIFALITKFFPKFVNQ
tara:strand:- start:4431 stop:4952 length:522 start_codon:yes stop_codon:yes gene_type:complete